VKKTEEAAAALQSRKIGLAGRASKSAAQNRATATGSNRVVLGPRPEGVAEEGGDEEEMANIDEEEMTEEEARDATLTETDTATSSVTVTQIETETGALATNA